MKGQYISIIRALRGMARVSRSIPALSKSLGQTQPITFHPTSAPAIPQPTQFHPHPINSSSFKFSSGAAFPSSRWKRPEEVASIKLPSATAKPVSPKTVAEGRSEYIQDESFGANLPSATVKPLAKDSGEYNDGESLRAIAKVPKPLEVPWQKENANTLHMIGMISQEMQFKYTNSGQPLAWTTLAVRSCASDETTWLELLFWNELAESAVQHLHKYDRVYVSGSLGSSTAALEDDNPHIFLQVIVSSLNFVDRTYPANSQQVAVNTDIPSPDCYRQADINMDAPFQWEESPVKSSSSGKETGENAATIHSLWEAFFANPDDWWDNRRNKRHPSIPDFRHKDTGEALWIENKSNPAWIKSVLATYGLTK